VHTVEAHVQGKHSFRVTGIICEPHPHKTSETTRCFYQEKSALSEMSLEFPFKTPPKPGTWQEVAPGVRWLRMPLPFALDHINLWLIRENTGWAIIDTGFALDAVETAWDHILTTLDGPIVRIIVTHFHPDHLGLAHWLMARTGAPLHITHGEMAMGQAIWHQLPGYDVAAMLAQFAAHGLEPARLQALAERGHAYRRGVPALPTVHRRLYEGENLLLGEHPWKVLIGHGHSPEHASLYSSSLGILISGDMLLPRISTNVSVWAIHPEDDPLGHFLESVARLRHLPENTLVLPSHGLPFVGLHPRVAQLKAHHEERCAALLLGLTEGPKAAGDLLALLFERELDTHQVMFAMGEAIAHLNHLVQQGLACIQTHEQGPIRFARCPTLTV
jgi:glyoxylase-like metal-dependent hydrolase (beta-lactamase superfamily II)